MRMIPPLNLGVALKSTAITFSLLMVTWLLWSGHTEPLLIIFGVVSCASVAMLHHRMSAHDGTDDIDHGLVLRSLTFVPWLAWEIIKANLDVMRIILHPALPIQPQLLRTPATQKTQLGRVIYANSITLTPGTITLDVRDGTFLIHALTDASAAGVKTGDMDRRVTRMEGKS